MNRHMWSVWLWQLWAGFWGRLGGYQGARRTKVQPSLQRFNAHKPSFGTGLFQVHIQVQCLDIFIPLFTKRGKIQSPSGSCWLGFDGRMREQGELHGSQLDVGFDGLKMCSPQEKPWHAQSWEWPWKAASWCPTSLSRSRTRGQTLLHTITFEPRAAFTVGTECRDCPWMDYSGAKKVMSLKPAVVEKL